MSGDNSSEFVGTWKLVSFSAKLPSGQIVYPFGKNAQGRLIYEPSGRMEVQIMNSNRPRFSSEDLLLTTEHEVRAAFGGYAAYYGTYSHNPEEGIIVHHIETALIPNWVGTDQIRHFDYDGECLRLKGPLMLGGVQAEVSLAWERLPD